MREILFRGKSVDDGEWVFGSLISGPGKNFILEVDQDVNPEPPEYHSQGMGCGLEDRNITDRYEAMEHGFQSGVDVIQESLPEYIEVDKKTIGQYTGLKDVNDVRIFEGDLVKIYHNGKWSKDTATIMFSYEYVGGWVAENDNQRLNIGTRNQHVKVVAA
jgi:uncharacterized phage protein (TIGR01671 family)